MIIPPSRDEARSAGGPGKSSKGLSIMYSWSESMLPGLSRKAWYLRTHLPWNQLPLTTAMYLAASSKSPFMRADIAWYL